MTAVLVEDTRTRERPRAFPRVQRRLRRVNGWRLTFRIVLAFFVSLILLSYVVPLWFQFQGDRLLIVTSGSMEPEIDVGDAVVVRPITDPSQLRVGQVITFWSVTASELVTHRIDSLNLVTRVSNGRPVTDDAGRLVQDAYVKTRGDANGSADPNLTPVSQVRGVVIAVHRGWGYLLGWAHSTPGRLLLFAPPLLLLMAAELWSHLPERVARAPWKRKAKAFGDRRVNPTSVGFNGSATGSGGTGDAPADKLPH